jgi:hypothetical protein
MEDRRDRDAIDDDKIIGQVRNRPDDRTVEPAPASSNVVLMKQHFDTLMVVSVSRRTNDGQIMNVRRCPSRHRQPESIKVEDGGAHCLKASRRHFGVVRSGLSDENIATQPTHETSGYCGPQLARGESDLHGLRC